MDQFWLTDEQFAKIASHLPSGTRGEALVTELADDALHAVPVIH